MNFLVKYVPRFCEGFEAKCASFHNIEELYKIDFLQSWLNDPNFKAFKILKDKTLMVELQDNKSYVVGFIKTEEEGRVNA